MGKERKAEARVLFVKSCLKDGSWFGGPGLNGPHYPSPPLRWNTWKQNEGKENAKTFYYQVMKNVSEVLPECHWHRVMWKLWNIVRMFLITVSNAPAHYDIYGRHYSELCNVIKSTNIENLNVQLLLFSDYESAREARSFLNEKSVYCNFHRKVHQLFAHLSQICMASDFLSEEWVTSKPSCEKHIMWIETEHGTSLLFTLIWWTWNAFAMYPVIVKRKGPPTKKTKAPPSATLTVGAGSAWSHDIPEIASVFVAKEEGMSRAKKTWILKKNL